MENKVKVTLYHYTKRGKLGALEDTTPFFTCYATSMGDAIRQANKAGLSCHNLDWNMSEPKDIDNPNWLYGFQDIDGLDLEGLNLTWYPCAHSLNYVENTNLRNANLHFLRPKDLAIVNCDLRGATVNWDDDCYCLDFHNSKMDEKTEITTSESYQVDWNMSGTILENNGDYMTCDKKKLFFDDCAYGPKLFEEMKNCRMQIVDKIEDANLIIVTDEKNLSERALKAKQERKGIITLNYLYFFLYLDSKEDNYNV